MRYVRLGLVLSILSFLGLAQAQVVRSFQEAFRGETTGDILIVGNTLMTCRSDGQTVTPSRPPTCDTDNQNQLNNDQQMVFVDFDNDSSTSNSSSSFLSLPSGAQVLWAGLYWGARADPNNANRSQIRIRPPGSPTYQPVTADWIATITDRGGTTSRPYAAFKDVTSLVQSAGSGEYWVANITGLTGSDSLGYYAGWSLVVAYQHPAEPFRRLQVFHGLASVNRTNNVTITVSGLLTPLVGTVEARVGAVSWEGDGGITGDSFQIKPTDSLTWSDLSDGVNPSNNFFNSTISRLGQHYTNRTPSYRNTFALDADVVQYNGLPNGTTSVDLRFTSTQDTYFPQVLTFAINLYLPDLVTTFQKSYNDPNGGQVVVGDELEFEISFQNTGTDGANNVVLTDPIPPGTQYVPGSLQVVQNAASAPTGTFTDASGDDIAEYSPSCPEHGGSPCVRFRLGSGANASQGGVILPGEGARVRFRVQVLPQAAGQTITNTAQISYNSLTLGTSFSKTASVSASVSIPYPPTLNKVFSPASIPPGSTSLLTITLGNPNPTPATLTSNLVDTLPSGLVVANPSGASTTCSGGTLTANPGESTITLPSGTQIPANGSCTLTVNVTASAPGSYTNILLAGALQTDLGANQEATSATLVVEGYTISGSVYHDQEPNGLKGPNEDWSTGTTVYVNLVQGNTVVASATVNPGTGTFSFPGVPPGTYTLLVTTSNSNTTPQAPSGWLFVNPGDGKRDISVSSHLQGLDFGLFHGGVVEGQIFLDDGLGGGTANNALRDGGEQGVGGVTVTATDGSNTRTASTDGNGYYRLYLPHGWGSVTLSHPLRPATGYNDGVTPTQVASWLDATGPSSSGARVSLGPASALAGNTWVRNFGVVRDSRLYPDGSGQTSSPGVYTFSHGYRPGTLGSVTLSLLSPPNPRYTYQVRVDLDCNGSFGPGEDWASFPYTFTVGTAWPREADGGLRACALEVRALVPAGEPAGAMDIALVEARLTWAGNPSVQEPDTLTDTLHVVGGEVRLEKRVRNISQNTPFATTAQGKPNEVLEYCIAYRNLGTQPVSNFVLSDPIPFFTEALTTVTDYGNKAIQWTHGSATQHLTAQTGDDAGEIASGLVRVLVGTVGPGEMGEVCYRVRIR